MGCAIVDRPVNEPSRADVEQTVDGEVAARYNVGTNPSRAWSGRCHPTPAACLATIPASPEKTPGDGRRWRVSRSDPAPFANRITVRDRMSSNTRA